MNQLTLTILLSFSLSLASAQQDMLIFKKRNKVISRYWPGTTIAFQLENKQWQKGEITKIQNDSFYIRPLVVRFGPMGTDSIHYQVEGYAFTDIYAMPNAGILIDYVNGHFQISGAGGFVHFYWIQSGALFRIGAAAYAGLNVVNGLIDHTLSISNNGMPLLKAAGVFIVGILLHANYKPYLRIGKKYRVVSLKLPRQAS